MSELVYVQSWRWGSAYRVEDVEWGELAEEGNKELEGKKRWV